MILILGGGLAGMSTAYHLRRRLPGRPRLVLEREPTPGGLCRSRVKNGFTFDYTGHYLHLRDPGTIALVGDLLGDELVEIDRRSEIHCRGARLPFPFQANLHGLPHDLVARCLIDFVNARDEAMPDREGRMPFGDWARQVFGDAIAETFMIPYNTKQFGVAANEITAEWVAWAVPRPDLAQVVGGALGLRNEGLGYNPRFRYPRGGGIGRLPAALAGRIAEDLQLDAEVEAIDAQRREVRLTDGRTHRYSQLVSTLPLPRLLERLTGLETRDGELEAGEIAARLRWSAVLDLQMGVARPDFAEGVHWIYFPELEYPFYRVGIPSNVCPAMAPPGCSAVSVEICHRPGTPPPPLEELVPLVREGLERAGMLDAGDEIVAAEAIVIDPAYVLFDEQCTTLVEEALRRLENAGILSIGRFGAWTYSYMERALIDGKEAATKLASVSVA
ncbi:MAG: NAD(P)-binding protein [Acidobacteriota bacterium]|nr:NAD(P)-binding protein [Acidobacteriota bacterium]